MDAANSLRASEAAALAGGPSYFTGKGKDEPGSSKPNLLKIVRKRYATLALIAIIFGGGAAVLTTAPSALPGSLVHNITEATDTQFGSDSKGTTKMIKYMLNHDSGKYRMTDSMKTRLKNQGIEFKKTSSGGVLLFKNKTINASDLKKTLDTDIDFRNAFSKAKRSRISGFFDKSASSFYSKYGITRNLFKNFRQTNNAKTDKKNYRKTMSAKFEGSSVDIKNSYTQEEERAVTDADGNESTVIDEKKVNPSGLEGETKGSDISAAETKAKSYVGDLAGKASKATTGANAACGLMQVGALISAAVAGAQIYQSMQDFMGIMENPSKAMAGDGDASAVNAAMNILNTVVTTKATDGDKEVEVTGAPIEANGLQMMLADAPASSKTTKMYSFESIYNSVAGGLGMSTNEARACTAASAVGAVISIATTIGTFGTSAIGQIIFDLVVGVGVSIAASAAISFIVPTVAKYLFTNTFETVIGIPAGEMLARGGAKSNTFLAQQKSSQAPASKAQALAYADVTNEALAVEAEVDRSTRSPFDITSKNTFLGSIVHSFLPIATTSRSTTMVNSMSSLTRLTSSSIASLNPSVSAKNKVNSSYMTTFGDCPNLESIGAVGDVYCNPIVVTDPSTIDITPDNAEYIDAISDQLEDCDDDGNGCTIKDDSKLAEYITYCNNRESPLGVVDANILGAVEKGNTILNSIPVISDVIDLYNAGVSEENINWATGQYCVAGKSNPKWSTFKYYQRYVEDQRILEQLGAYEDSTNPVTGYIEEYEAKNPVDNSPSGIIARFSGMTKENAEIALAYIEYQQYLEDYDPSTRIAMEGDASDLESTSEIASAAKSEKLFSPETSSKAPQSEKFTLISQHIIYADIRNRNYSIA